MIRSVQKSHWLLALLAAVATLEAAAPASACSRACAPPVQLPRGGGMSGNMVYFKLLTDNPGELKLHTKAGEVIAASIRTIGNDRVFAPDEAIAGNTDLVLEYTSDCGVPSSFEFVATAPGSIELRPAELVIQEQGLSEPGLPGELSFVRLRYYSPDANGQAYSLMSDRFTVDGKPPVTVLVNGAELIQLATRCYSPVTKETLSDTCGFVRELPPGRHTVVATTTVVGQLTQPEPATLEIDLRCPGDDAESANVRETDPGTPIEGLPGTTETSAATPEGGAGCTISAAHRSAAPRAALLTLLFGLAQMRRWKRDSRRA